MERVNQHDLEIRSCDAGVKYLFRGPHIDWGVLKMKPGDTLGHHYHDRVEETLRGWLVKHSESEQFDDAAKARVQLLLARNYFKARRYDVARSEYTTVINRYGDSPQAVEAEFGEEAVLEGAEGAFDAAFGLGGVGGDVSYG